jgi:hypothetical protein
MADERRNLEGGDGGLRRNGDGKGFGWVGTAINQLTLIRRVEEKVCDGQRESAEQRLL